MGKSETILVRLARVTDEARDVRSFEFVAADATSLPGFEPGAHIDIHLPGGAVRSYSLVNPADGMERYVVAVLRSADPASSSHVLHSATHPGDLFTVSMPRNHFALDDTAPHSVLIAGGIGVTPIVAMAEHLARSSRPFEVYYSARSKDEAAFVPLLESYGDRVHIAFDVDHGGPPFNLADVIGRQDIATHVYCCGPTPMLAAFVEVTAGRVPKTVHLEHFSNAQSKSIAGEFVVELARSGRTVTVSRGETILSRLLEEGFDVGYSCQEGTCGECETAVLSGTPDHRDVVLTRRQRQSNAVMMPCCSGSLTPSITLDL